MALWRLSQNQVQVLRQAIASKSILEVGGGDGSLALFMVKLGAARVTVIEKEQYISRVPESTDFPIRWFNGYVANFYDHTWSHDHYDVVVFSWPPNSGTMSIDSIRLLHNRQVVVVGVNDGKTTACGQPPLWRYLITRQLSCFVSGENDLLIYDLSPRDPPRPQVLHELHGLDMDSQLYELAR